MATLAALPGRCERCGSSRNLRAHHKDGRGPSGPRGLELANIELLCAACHHAQHPRDGERR